MYHCVDRMMIGDGQKKFLTQKQKESLTYKRKGKKSKETKKYEAGQFKQVHSFSISL